MFKAPTLFGRLLSRSFVLLTIVLAAGPLRAADAAAFCADVKILVNQAHGNFSNWTRDRPGAALPGADDCALRQSLAGPKSYVCAWAFPYRAAEAHGTFETFNRSLQDCFGDPAPSGRDHRVNHPDSYDLRQYRSGRVEVAVSIKDKSALQKTYLFLRVHGEPGD